MRRAVLSTFLFVAILGLGCMGVVTHSNAITDRFDGQWTAKLNSCGVTPHGQITYDFQLQVSSDEYRIRATAVVDFESGAGQ